MLARRLRVAPFTIQGATLLRLAAKPRDRLLKSLTTSERDRSTGGYRTVPKTRPTVDDRRPGLAAAGYTLPGGKYVPLPGVESAYCDFSDITIVYCWHRRRPALDAAAVRGVPDSRHEMADGAITQCPDVLEGALRLALGPDFEAHIAKVQATAMARGEREAKVSQERDAAARQQQSRRKQGAVVLAATTTVNNTHIVFLRPSELVAYGMGKDIGNSLRGLGKAAEQAATLRRMVADLDARLGRTRRELWSCWSARCGETGLRYWPTARRCATRTGIAIASTSPMPS